MLNVNRGIRALALGVVVGCMSVTPQIASAQTGPIRIDAPLIFQTLNPCNGELVDLTGTQISFFYERYDNLGGRHVTVRVKNQGSGTGTADGGITVGNYNYHSEESFKFNDLSSGTVEQTVLTKTMVVRQGSLKGTDDDFIFKTNVHFTINSIGVVTAQQGNVIFECK
jgi:hypothetical protein